jgi:hypothetical protein
VGDVITALVGFIGVLVGGFVAAYASARAEIRSQGRAAAGLAAEGLASWTDAVDLLKKRELSYPRDATYDVFMAIDLSAIRDLLTMEWWETNRAGLVGVASDDQWADLTAAGKASRGMLLRLSSIGDVGKEVWMRRAEVLVSRPPGSPSKGESTESPSNPSNHSEPDAADSAFEATLAGARKDIAKMKALGAELREKEFELRMTEALLDHRLYLVRDVQRSLVSAAGPKFAKAASVCHELEEANKGPLGLLGAIRRRLSLRWRRRSSGR